MGSCTDQRLCVYIQSTLCDNLQIAGDVGDCQHPLWQSGHSLESHASNVALSGVELFALLGGNEPGHPRGPVDPVDDDRRVTSDLINTEKSGRSECI